MRKRAIWRSILVLVLCCSLVLNVFAATTTETIENEDGTVTVIVTDQTVTTVEGDKTVVTDVTSTTTTTTDENGDVVSKSWTEEGSEITSWTEEDTGAAPGQPEVEVELNPGETTTAEATTTTTTDNVTGDADDVISDTTTTTTTERVVTAETSEEEVTVTEQNTSMKGLQSVLKFDRNSSADQVAKRQQMDLYTDNGHFTDPSKITVTDTPDGYAWQYVGSGDYSGHYVSHIRVIYERDENGNAIVDENGEYVIKELQHSNGTILTKGGVPTTDLNGPYDQTTGTRPSQFLLMNEAGEAVYAYCIDMDTPTAEGKPYYAVANLEDNDYYATEDAENHVRNIALNGYWGTAEGTGSITQVREDLRTAVANGTVDKEYDITFVIRVQKYAEGYELQEGEYIASGYVCKQVTEHVVLTDDVINAFTEGEAMDATQCAIWSFANGSRMTLDGTDRMIVGDITYASCALGDSRNKQNDFAGAARTLAFYNYLIGLDEEQESTVVINDKNNVDDVSLTVGDQVAGHAANQDADVNNDVYNANLNFKLAFIPGADDDLLVHISYTDLNGNTVNIVKRLAGVNEENESYETIYAEADGTYILSGLQLSENKDFSFDLRLEGVQYLEQGVYIYTAQGGTNASQTMVGVAEGMNEVDISKSMTIRFDVDENDRVVAERIWSAGDETVTPDLPGGDNYGDLPDGGNVWPDAPNGNIQPDGAEDLEEIEEEEVPLADVPNTGDASMMFTILAILSACGLAVLAVTKKREQN